jgi:hypothetical protein
MRLLLLNPPHPAIGSRIPAEHLPPLGLLATRRVPPWRTLLWVKLIEAVAQLRPRSLRRLFAHPDPALRAAMRWFYAIGRQVWPHEIWQFLFHDHRTTRGPALDRFLGPPATPTSPSPKPVPIAAVPHEPGASHVFPKPVSLPVGARTFLSAL